MSKLIKDLGAVSAYAYAVEKGYTGTEDEFAELMYDYADVAQTAVEAKDEAVSASTSAQASATTANTKADEASASASKAQSASNSAQGAETNAETFALNAGTKATEAKQFADKAELNAQKTQSDKETVESAKSDVLSAVDNAQNYANSAQSASQAIQDMDVKATTLEPDSDATVEKTVDAISGAVTITYGIPKGIKGDKGNKGDTGDSGVYIGASAPSDENVKVWIDSDGEPDDVIQIDDTLTQSGQAADAKKAGDEITSLKSGFSDFKSDISALTGTLTATDITTPKGSTKVNILTIDLFAGNTITVTIKRDAELNVYTYFYIYDAEGNDINPKGGSVASFKNTQTEISFQFTPNADYPNAQLLHTVSANASTNEHITEIIVEFSGELGEIRGTAESTARRLNDIDTVVSTTFESGDIGAQNSYVANSKKIRTPQGQAIHLSVGSTITIASGAKVYLRGIKENGKAYDGGTWKTGVYTVSTELNYLFIVSYDPEATVTDINALASMVTVRSVQTNPILKTQADVDEVYDMLGKNLSFGALKGTIDSVSGEKVGGTYPHIYSADAIEYTKTAVYNYAGIEMRIDDFTIGNTIAVRANRDIETTAFMIRIDFYGEDGTRVAPEKTTTENVLKRVIPDGTSYILVTLPSNWGSALDVGTTVTYSNIDIYYSDIEDLRDEEGNTTYTGEKIVLTNDNPKEHLCTVTQWLEYSESDLIEGLTTNKAFYKNQSMTIYGGYVFFFSENGGGFVADYSTKAILSEFNTEPATVNHNNSAQFSDIYYADDDEFPLLFVSRCGNASYQSGEHDIDEMLIYRVVRADTTFTFTLINTVKINAQTYGMSWGVDNVRHILYACAPINGNWQVQTGNYVDFWMVKEPTKSQILSGTPIVIGEDGIVAHFSHDYFTGQGCAVNGGKLFLGVSSGKQWVWVVDVFRGKILSKIPITNIAELEGVAIYNDKIYTTHKNSTNLYMFEVSF